MTFYNTDFPLVAEQFTYDAKSSVERGIVEKEKEQTYEAF